MDTTRLLATLRAQGEIIAATPADALSEPVPAVPGWTIEHVVRHAGKVHQWVSAALREPADAPLSSIRRGGDMPRGPECLTTYRGALQDLLDEFTRRGPADPAPTMEGPGTASWWARRQAHEASVHRIDVADALHAAGGPAVTPLDADVAADGVDEWLQVFLPRLAQGGRLPDELGGRSIHLHGTDTAAAEWHLAFDPGAVAVTREHRKADVALRGGAQDLLLTLWRRRPVDDLDCVGDVSVARMLLSSAAL